MTEPTEAEFQERWRVAQEEGRRVQSALDKGYLVMDGEQRVMNMQVTEEGVFEASGGPTFGSRTFWFWNDRSLDNGYYTPAEKIREQFRRLKFFAPAAQTQSCPEGTPMNELEIAKKAVKTCLDELRELRVFECPACKTQVKMTRKEVHETGCSIAVTLGLPTSDDPEGSTTEDDAWE